MWMPTVAFHTLGCKVNHYETEAVWELFKNEGYEKVDFKEVADVYIINTCTVTNTGDKKSRQVIRRAIRRNPEAVMCVMGCYAQTKPKEIMEPLYKNTVRNVSQFHIFKTFLKSMVLKH